MRDLPISYDLGFCCLKDRIRMAFFGHVGVACSGMTGSGVARSHVARSDIAKSAKRHET